MKKKIYSLSFILTALAGTAIAQPNLVNNPGFENIDNTCTLSGYVNLIDWDNPDQTDTCSTPDLFSTCQIAIAPTHAPNTQLGYQQPHGGTAFGGFISYDQLTANYREYVEGSLSSAMLAGKKYTVKFYLSLANNSPITVNHLGVYFSNAWNYYTTSPCVTVAPLPNTPQIDTVFATPFVDTTNWVEMKWTYTATGGEQFFTIGNFKNNAGTTTSPAPNGPSLFTPFAYYFVDDISVVQDTTAVEDTTNPESVRYVGINDRALSIYPSPAGSFVNVEYKGVENMKEISIVNCMGAVVYRRSVNTAKETIMLDGLANGFYTIRIVTDKGMAVRKLEVQH